MFKSTEDSFSIKYIKTFLNTLIKENEALKHVSLDKLKYDSTTGLYILFLSFKNIQEIGKIHLNERLNKLMITRGLNINYLIIWNKGE